MLYIYISKYIFMNNLNVKFLESLFITKENMIYNFQMPFY